MKKKIFIAALLLLTTGCSLVGNKADASSTKEIIDQSYALKTKKAQVDPRDSEGKTGLLMYGYDNGASFQYGNPYNGVFKTTIRPVYSEYGNKDLKEFSLLFTETSTKQQFAIKVFVFDSYSYVAINYKGELGGINYFENYAVGKTCGYSGLANNENHFTYIEGSGDIDLLFDPNELLVQTKLTDNAYHDVWDFGKENNDGHCIVNDLHKFEEYTITIVFDSISANGCGNLMIYNFAGLDLTNSDLNSDKPLINTHIVGNPVVGETYTLPTPTVSSPKDGVLDPNDINIVLYNQKGDVVHLSDHTFTPNEEGKYYAYYLYQKGNITSYTYECLTAIKSSEVNVSFSDVYLPSAEGQGKELIVPDVVMTTNLGVKSNEFDCFVTIKFNDEILPGYTRIRTGGLFKFTSKGKYTFVYGSNASNVTLEKNVIVDGRLTINGDDEYVYSVGQMFTLPDLKFFKFGREVGYIATIYDPFGNKIDDETFMIEQEGIYTISYKLASEIEPYEKDVVVKKLTASNFNDPDAVTDNMITDNSIKGVKLSLKNNKVVTYDKVIDLKKFGFDSSLEDKSQNKEIIKLYIQPNTQKRADLEAVYIQLTDVNDPTNFITIRCRYIEQGTFQSGSFIRARANGQSAYVGYYYHFYTTAMNADNAMSHEEGGFIHYCNFTHTPNGEQYDQMGLPIYFDNSTGRLYSRPAWLTGHNYVSSDEYDKIQVPWLIYDFKTDDPKYTGGNVPWKGFSDGNVKISIYGKGISSTASVYVTSIGGETLDERFITDEECPEINFSKDDFVANPSTGILEAPKAICGKPYKIFDYKVKDALSDVKQSSVKVINPNGDIVNVTNNTFTPDIPGKYGIIYDAIDVFNNASSTIVSVEATNGDIPIYLSIEDPAPTDMVYGTSLTLPVPNYGGGSGKLSLKVKVTNENGIEVPVVNNEITATVPGTKYTVRYTVEDYLNQKKEYAFDINVNLTDDIIFDSNSIVLPSGFINKTSYTFNSFVGVTYDSSYNPTYIPAQIKVSDANGTVTLGSDLKYTALWSEDVNKALVSISFKHGSTEDSYNYIVPIIKPATNSYYISSYFTTSNAVPTPSDKGIMFASDGKTDMSFNFVRPIYSNELLLMMGLNTDKIDATIFSVTLSDMYNPNEVIKLRFQYKYDTVSETMKLFADLNESNNFTVYNIGESKSLCIDYSELTHQIKDTTGASIFDVKTYMNGTTFNGFSSNYVYFSFEANGINDGNFEIEMQKINNQGTNSIRRDYEDPVFTLNGKIENRVSRGTEIIIPTAFASDILNDVATFEVTVTDPNGNIVVDAYTPDHETTFTTDLCGTYIVTYMATDSKGNGTPVTYYIISYDEVQPELKLNGTVPAEVSVGTTVSLPSYTVIDNEPNTCTVKIFVYNPDGTSNEVKNRSITCSQKGLYVVTYMVTDANNNVRHYVFTIRAK